MSYSLSNGLSISLAFGSAEFPLDANNRISSLHILESVQVQVPQLTLELVDTTKFLESLGLQDGLPIRISISYKNQNIHQLNFRLFSYTPVRENFAQKYTILGYLDLPKYWLGLATKSIRGTSASALSQIAAECGLEFIGINTVDSQLWIPRCSKYCEFAKYIADRGYASKTSCMVLSVNLMKQMMYCDVMNLGKPQVVLRALMTNSDSEYCINSYKVSGASGLSMANGGYYTTRVLQSVTADQYSSKIESMEVNRNVSSPSINSVVREIIKKQAVVFGPIDCGNSSEFHDAALYQNKRLKSLYSVTGEFVATRPTPLSLCVPFTFYAANTDGTPNAKDSGVYTTTGRIIYISNAIYSEKIIGSRIGTNAKYYSN